MSTGFAEAVGTVASLVWLPVFDLGVLRGPEVGRETPAVKRYNCGEM